MKDNVRRESNELYTKTTNPGVVDTDSKQIDSRDYHTDMRRKLKIVVIK